MVSSNGLINRYESNRLIFKSTQFTDKAGNISDKLTWSFGQIGRGDFLGNTKNTIRESNKNISKLVTDRDRQAINDFNKMVNTQNMTVSEAVSHMTQASDAARNYCAGLKDGTADADEFVASQEKIRKETEKSQKGFKGLSASTKAMAGNIIGSLAIGFALQAIGMGWDALNDKLKLTKESRADAMESTISDYDKATSTANDNIKTIKSLRDEYNELSRGIGSNGENLSLTAEQYDRYNEIANQLAEMNPKLVRGYTLEGNAIIDRNNAIKEGIEAQEEYAKSATKQYLAGGSDIYGGVKDQLIANKKEMSATAASISNMLGGVQKTGHAYGRSGKTTGAEYNDVINKALGKQIDLENASAETLREVAQNKEKILATAIETNGWNQAEKEDLKKINDLNEDLLKMSNQASLYEDAAQPITVSFYSTLLIRKLML